MGPRMGPTHFPLFPSSPVLSHSRIKRYPPLLATSLPTPQIQRGAPSLYRRCPSAPLPRSPPSAAEAASARCRGRDIVIRCQRCRDCCRPGTTSGAEGRCLDARGQHGPATTTRLLPIPLRCGRRGEHLLSRCSGDWRLVVSSSSNCRGG